MFPHQPMHLLTELAFVLFSIVLIKVLEYLCEGDKCSSEHRPNDGRAMCLVLMMLVSVQCGYKRDAATYKVNYPNESSYLLLL
jgi:hypothetical protein